MPKPRTYKGHAIIDGLAYNTVLTRVNAGWSVEDACSKPPMSQAAGARTADTPWRTHRKVGYFASMKTRFGK